MDDAGLRDFDPKLLHRRLEDLAVLAALDRRQVDADDLHAVLLEDALLRELHGKIEARLPSQVRKNGIGPLFLDDLLETRFVERFNVSRVGHHGIRHDRRGIRINEDNLVPAGPQGLARLRSRIVKLASLSNDNWTRTDDENLVDIRTLHQKPLSG